MKPNSLFKGKYTKKALFAIVPVILCAIIVCVFVVSLNDRNAQTEKGAGGENLDIMSSERGEEDMEKLYERINFENAPSTKTPLNEETMNKIDIAIDELDNRVIQTTEDIADSLGEFYLETSYAINLAISSGYYNLSTGAFVEDSKRMSAVVDDVKEGDKFAISTLIRPATIAGILYMNDGAVIGYDLRGTGTDESIVDYEFIIPSGVNSLIVQSADNVSLSLAKKRTVSSCTQSYEKMSICVGGELVDGNLIYGTGWNGDSASGYTHTTGTGALTLNKTLEAGCFYLVEFDTSYDSGEFGTIGIGGTPKSMMYNGTAHISMVLYATLDNSGGCKLRLSPYDDFEGTLSNFSVRKVVEDGTEKVLNSFSVLSQDNDNHYGFYNTIIGHENLQNNPTSTRTIAIGFRALKSIMGGHRNVGIGTFSMSQLKEGDENISIGADCMFAVKKGSYNIAMGKGSLYKATEANNNVSIGHNAMKKIDATDSIEGNVAIGSYSNYRNNGNKNTCIGFQSGYTNTNGNNNVCIGAKSDVSDGVSDSVAIGHDSKATKSNQMVLGSENVTEVIFCGNKKINFNADGTVTWELISE